MTELRIKYLEMIQKIVDRMAANQFQARAWSVALGTAVIGFAAAKDGNPRAALLAILPTLLFWRLDAYFLALERRYRALFDRERLATDPPTFSLDTSALTPPGDDATFWRTVVWSVHLPVVLLALAVAAYGFLHHLA